MASDSERPGYISGRDLSVGRLVALLLLPLALISPNAIALTLAVAAALMLAAQPASCLTAIRRLGAVLRRPAILAAMPFLAWAALSCLWSPDPLVALSNLARAALTLTLFVLLLAVVEQQASDARALHRTLRIAVLIAATVLVLVGSRDGTQWINAWSGLSLKWFHFNRAGVVLALLLPFILAEPRLRTGAKALLAGFCVAAVLATESETAKLSGVVALAAFLAASYAPRTAISLFAGIALAALLSMPLLVGLALDVIPPGSMDMLREASLDQRLRIMQQYAALIPLRPVAGWGLEGARIVFDHFDSLVPPDLRLLDRPRLHPHNQALQIWFEFGLMGALLFGAWLAVLLHRIHLLPPRPRALALALSAGLFATGLVSHGLWQSWWLVLICALALLAVAIGRQRERNEAD